MTEAGTELQPQLAPTSSERDEEFVALMARHQLPLTAFLRTFLRSPADVDDVLQETNLVLWRKRCEYDPDRPFASWACRIAQLQTMAFLKSKGRKSLISLSENVIEDLAKRATLQLSQLDQRAEELRNCVAKLPSAQQSILQSRYQHNVSVNELAKRLGRQPQAVAMTLYRLRKSLKDCVERALSAEALQ
ncbi:sigma-70 family RNA polymerase sigma factor [Blastopirellula marina]|uniref:Probable extracytoplasmic function alternative sigma factor n=1 Tax=Blastopirellula marina DSM 3645 TaxID=314230 RepID=A3ZSG4_9BACT|nr:sigma-70 family RNA polymerase sigma factor [Blastopirellula marina]EAQ80624.1 probable extracytoplasmic function alternative sigma factor [Blastopirellula marina DSM 3645]